MIAWTLIEKGADVNARGGEYGTALQAALFGGHDTIAWMLIEEGANDGELHALTSSARTLSGRWSLYINVDLFR